jgi:hypothetical protein
MKVAVKAATDKQEREEYYAQYDQLIEACTQELATAFISRLPESLPVEKRDKQNLVGAIARDMGFVLSDVQQRVTDTVREKVGLEWKK